MLLGESLRRHALPAGRPDHPALIYAGRSWTYRDLNSYVNRVAHGLCGLGVSPGDRVALLGRNSDDWVAAYYACAKLGAVLVPVNFWYKAEEIGCVLHQSGASVILAETEFAPQLAAVRPQVPGVAHWVTGLPKGAVHTQRSHVLHAAVFCLRSRSVPEDVYLAVYPLFHTGGTDCGVVPYLYLGATAVLLRRPDPEAILAAVQPHRVTNFMAVPTLWHRLLHHPDLDRYDLSSLTRTMGSSDAMPPPLLRRLYEKLGVGYIQTYGCTEAGPLLTYLQPDDMVRKLGSAGRPHHHAEIRIVGPDGAPLPAGAVGEVTARTDTAMLGYWDLPEQSAATLRNGWLHTGDLGYLDDEGYLWITGRLKDMIISGGENIYPVEVERVILEHPGVQEVAVIGVPDPEWGEAVMAVVVPRPGGPAPTAESIINLVRRRLAGFKKPKYVELVPALPKTTSTGKVQKAALRQQYLTPRCS